MVTAPGSLAAGPAGARVAAHVYVALTVDLQLLLEDGAGDLLGVLNLALADGHLFRDDRLLAHVDLVFLDGDADLLRLDVPGRRAAARGPPFDDDLLALDRYVDRFL